MYRNLRIASLVYALFSFALVYAQENPIKYSQVRVYVASKNDILALQKAGLQFDHIDYQGTYFDVVLNDQELALLKKMPQRFDLVIDDLEAEYRHRPKLTPAQTRDLETAMKQQYKISGFNFGSMGGYYTFAEVVAELDEMRMLYPNLISVKQSIGNSLEQRTIWMARISDNPDIDENEEEVLYTALHHAREPQSMASVIYFMWYLLENYGVDPAVNCVIENRELYFIPVVNPDGYVYNQSTNPSGGGFWRKNRRNNGNGTFGVDLNRNYGFQWGFDNFGSSPTPASDTYRGAGPFSEPETQVIRDFVIAHSFSRALNYHSFGNLLIFPWGYLPSFFTPDHSTFVALAQDMTQFNMYSYGTANQTVGYLVNGEANDWFYGEQTVKNKVLGMTPEVGSGADGFWPNISRIIPIASENVYPNMVLARGLNSPPPPTCTVEITAPPDSALLCVNSAKVTATFSISGGVPPFTIVCDINGVPGTVSGSTFTATVPLTPGWNDLIATCSISDGCGGTTVCRDTTAVFSIIDKIPPDCVFTFRGISTAYGKFIDNESGIASVTPLLLYNCTLTVDPIPPFPADASQVDFRLDALGLDSYFGFDIKITDRCGNVHICDPVMSYLSTDRNDRQYTLKFRSVDRYLIVANHGLSEIHIDLNGHQFSLYAEPNAGVRTRNAYRLPRDGNLTIDLQPYLREGENLMHLEIAGAAGTNAELTLIDEAHDIDHTLELQPIPEAFQLSQNYPNPFNPSTTIHFSIPAKLNAGIPVQLRIYNAIGELVRTLVDETIFPGQYAIEWDGRNSRGEITASGIYIYQFIAGEFRQTKRMIFLK
jgi:hypothetical protein